MTPPIQEFLNTTYPEPHKARTREILKNHPEVRELFGNTPATVVWVVLIVALQVGMTWALRDAPWWGVFVAAVFVGAVANHALFVMIHECSHNLIWKKKSWNLWTAILANLPIVVPSSMSFVKYHLKHHLYQGDYDLDADIPARWEARMIGNSALGKATWLAFFPLFQSFRTIRFNRVFGFWDRWVIANTVVQFSFDIAVLYFLGPTAFAYLLLSAFLSVGLHPVGGRWIQEHYLVHPPQETYSYYGPANLTAFNVGFHNEHHDFPYVAWSRLPQVKALAPEAYDGLRFHTSWSALVWQFLFDPRLSLWSRAIRDTKAVEK